MTDKTTYYRDALHLHLRGGTLLPQPSQFYVALSTAAPGDDLAGLAEPPGANGYARQPINLVAGVGNILENDALIRFGPNTGTDWGLITHFVIFDALTLGNGWYWDALVTSRNVQVGNPLDFEAGNLTIDEQ